MRRLTARSRLTLLCTGLVVVTGAALIMLTYVLMSNSLQRRFVVQFSAPGTVPPPLPPVPDAAKLAGTTLSDLLIQASIALAVVALLTAALGRLVAGRVLRPIRAVTTTAARLSAENIGERVPVGPPDDELAALTRTINGMLDRIQRGIAERDRVLAGQRLFTANAAHELRTPLATMRTAVEVTLDGEPSRAELLAMAADIAAAVEHSQHTLDGLLTLARSGIRPGDPSIVDLAELTAGALDATAAADLTVRAELDPAPVFGHAVLLERLAVNLIDNAIRHNQPSGWVVVSTGSSGAESTLRVANSGRPISAQEAAGLPEPFVRGTPARTGGPRGTGLGLAIVRAVTEAHHGSLTVEPGPDGGLIVTIRVPATA